jgi:serine/threonine protein kinase
MSIEAMKNEYSKESDVWSFGCLVWEIMTQLNLDKYFDGKKTFDFLFRGCKMEIKEIKDGQMRSLVEACWDPCVDKRPSFRMINEELDKMLSVVEFSTPICTELLNDDKQEENVYDENETEIDCESPEGEESPSDDSDQENEDFDVNTAPIPDSFL